MCSEFIERSVEAFGQELEEVIVAVASRIGEVPSLIMGRFSIPECARGTPSEFDLLVSTPVHRCKLVCQLQGIFRYLEDGSVLFCDGGVELELRLRV